VDLSELDDEHAYDGVQLFDEAILHDVQCDDTYWFILPLIPL